MEQLPSNKCFSSRMLLNPCADEEYDNDAGLELAESRAKRGDAAKQAQREKQRQIRDYKRLSSALVGRLLACFPAPFFLSPLLSFGGAPLAPGALPGASSSSFWALARRLLLLSERALDGQLLVLQLLFLA